MLFESRGLSAAGLSSNAPHSEGWLELNPVLPRGRQGPTPGPRPAASPGAHQQEAGTERTQSQAWNREP